MAAATLIALAGFAVRRWYRRRMAAARTHPSTDDRQIMRSSQPLHPAAALACAGAKADISVGTLGPDGLVSIGVPRAVARAQALRSSAGGAGAANVPKPGGLPHAVATIGEPSGTLHLATRPAWPENGLALRQPTDRDPPHLERLTPPHTPHSLPKAVPIAAGAVPAVAGDDGTPLAPPPRLQWGPRATLQPSKAIKSTPPHGMRRRSGSKQNTGQPRADGMEPQSNNERKEGAGPSGGAPGRPPRRVRPSQR